MSAEVSVSEDVKQLIDQIIIKQNLKGVSSIKYHTGSEAGDGYLSKTVAVDIVNEKADFHVFIKCGLNMKPTDVMPIDKLYKNEIYFYEKIYPAYEEFCKSRGVENGLENIPSYYGTLGNNVALENIKEKKFTLFDRSKCLMNDAHIELVLKSFAKFHAVSYAFKDQETTKYNALVEDIYDFFSEFCEKETFLKLMKDNVNKTIGNLDVVADKDILEKCKGLVEKLRSTTMMSAKKTLNEYSILTQGDCHCNNMMFLYEGENKETPSNVMLIDWQCIRQASPVFDLSYFFYPIASEEALDNLSYYLKLYHEELCKRIRVLGSDPEVLYPYEILEKEWKQHCKYGFTTAFNIIRMMLSTGDEIFDLESFDFDDVDNQTVVPNLEKEEEYLSRMKVLLKHMIKNDFL